MAIEQAKPNLKRFCDSVALTHSTNRFVYARLPTLGNQWIIASWRAFRATTNFEINRAGIWCHLVGYYNNKTEQYINFKGLIHIINYVD